MLEGKVFFFHLYVSYHRNTFLASLNPTEAEKQPAEKLLTTKICEGDGNNISLNAFKTAVAVGTATYHLVLWSCLLADYHLHSSASVKLNVMPVRRNEVYAEEEERNKTHNVKASSCMSNWYVLNVSVHVRSVVLYEYLRHSMTSHSGC